MKAFMVCCLLSAVLAEPPVGDGYPAGRSSYQADIGLSAGFQRSQGYPDSIASTRNQEYPSEYAPSNVRSSPSTQYGVPNLRSGISTEYGPPDSQSFAANTRTAHEFGSAVRGNFNQGLPSSRGLSQEYGVPAARNGDFSFNISPDQEYGVPNLRNTPSNSYLPASRSAPANTYIPAARSSVSTQYGPPEFNSIDSDYNTPSLRESSQFSQKTPSNLYGAPAFGGQSRNSLSQQYGVPKTRSKPASTVTRSFGLRNPSQSYGVPSRSPSTDYGVPSARNAADFSQGFGSVSQEYGVPSQRNSLDYLSSNTRGVSQEYGVPNLRSAHSKAGATAASYTSARSSPSQKYGPPSARSMPSDTYGVPEQYSSLSSQGYSYARNAEDELNNQEPANYGFDYKVNDEESGSDFGHKEFRQENRAEGSYFVVLPDGTKQVVEYEADERGFKPRISVEPADASLRSGGYDANAANINGPY